jgi:type IV fimbrial biogenesis protein FimT
VLSLRRQRGFNLIELMIGVTIFGFLMMMAIPSFTTFLANTRIKNAAETTMHGLNLARAEAVRRNSTVRFQFVSDLTGGCVLSTTSLTWIVSVTDPTGLCNVTPGSALAPQIVQVKSGAEGTDNVALATTGGSTLVFTGLGRVQAGGMTQLLFTNPTGGTCEHLDLINGKMRCMQINLSTAGSAKICDPKVIDPLDPRSCA